MSDLRRDIAVVASGHYYEIRRQGMTAARAPRKWLIRRQRDEHGQVRGHHGWIVTAPSGERRWFFTWSSLEALCPFFVMGEQCPALRGEAPRIFDGGVRI